MAPPKRLANISRAADRGRRDLAPVAAGLLLYDALYQWARDGVDETHDDGPKGQKE